MKKFICQVLEALINKINPTYEIKAGYEAKQLRVTIGFDTKDVKRFMRDKGIDSFAQAKKRLILDIKDDNVARIMVTARKFMDERVYVDRKSGDTVVDTSMPIYLSKEDCKKLE